MALSAWFPRYPVEPGYKDRDTSREAADAMTDRTRQLQRIVLNHLTLIGPSTADECAAGIGETVLATRPRLTELLRLGRIRDTGDRRKNASGRSAKVWAAI